MLMISLSDRFLWLDRMHEAQGRLRQGVGDKPHLRNGSNIEMRNSALPERLQKLRRRIRLDRIKRLARNLFSKESSRPTCILRTTKRYRPNRLEGSSYTQGAMMLVQFKGPPVGRCALTHCLVGDVTRGDDVR